MPIFSGFCICFKKYVVDILQKALWDNLDIARGTVAGEKKFVLWRTLNK